MNEITYERLKENLESLKLRNTLEILDNDVGKWRGKNVGIWRRGMRV